jgi:hypothetical protein
MSADSYGETTLHICNQGNSLFVVPACGISRCAWTDLPTNVPTWRQVKGPQCHNLHPCRALYFPICPIQPECTSFPPGIFPQSMLRKSTRRITPDPWVTENKTTEAYLSLGISAFRVFMSCKVRPRLSCSCRHTAEPSQH